MSNGALRCRLPDVHYSQIPRVGERSNEQNKELDFNSPAFLGVAKVDVSKNSGSETNIVPRTYFIKRKPYKALKKFSKGSCCEKRKLQDRIINA